VIGRIVGSYKIVEKLGEGGMGEVYRAVHPLLGRPAAVKVLLPEMSRDETALNRFFQEARSTALIGHPGIIDIFDYGHSEDGHAYLVMELLHGETLTERLKRENRVSPQQAVQMARQIAAAVGAAHTAGVVHRDLKPDNLFLLPDRDSPSGVRLKVLDFGIAKLADRARPSHVTQAGIALGSPRYMSPEQCRNAAGVDGRADIYSLGCILHEMLSGTLPFEKASFAELMAAHLSEPPMPLRVLVPSLPGTLEQIVLRALAKDPKDRFQTMEDMAQALEAVGPNLRDSVPAVTPIAGVAALTGSAPGAKKETTTLGHAASQMDAQAEGGRRLGLPIGIGVFVGVAAFAMFLVARETGTPSTPVAEVVEGPVPGVELPVPAAQPPAAPAVAPPAADPPVAPAMVQLRVDSEPAGAEVYRAVDGVRVGKTPVVHETSPVRGEMVFLVRLSGYEKAQVTLRADQDGSAKVKLKKEKSRRRERKSSSDGALDPFE
jgi:eukaryotic-like serine/threonine-protein kinase